MNIQENHLQISCIDINAKMLVKILTNQKKAILTKSDLTQIGLIIK